MKNRLFCEECWNENKVQDGDYCCGNHRIVSCAKHCLSCMFVRYQYAQWMELQKHPLFGTLKRAAKKELKRRVRTKSTYH